MPFFIDYFFLNVLVFLANILIGYFIRRPVLVASSAICLGIMIYIKGLDYGQRPVYLLDQIAMLGVLVPGLYAWIEAGPHKRLLAGTFFLIASAIYLSGFLLSKFGHSQDRSMREFWHFVIHMFSTGGHLAILLEPALLALLLGK